MTVSFPSSVASVAVVATLAVQCAGGPAVSTAGTVPLAAAPMRCHEARWSSCLEKPPLPCGGEAWEQEVAMRPAARAAEVRKAARDTLLKRLCRPTRVCAALDAHIHVWQTAQGPGNRVCAQALIRRRDHQRWLKTHTGIADLPAQLSKVAGELRAQTTDDEFAMAASLDTRLAYVITGDNQVDEMSRAGLYGLSNILRRRTSVENAEPMGVELEIDDIVFFPLLYWPLTPDFPNLSALAMAKVDAFMKGGGTILFDTRDQQVASIGALSGNLTPEGQRLRQILGKLDVPPLTPVPPKHILTRAFYLMQRFPGRWAGGKVWVERHSGGINDGVSGIIIGSNDWAAAWAMDQNGQPMAAVVPEGSRQRELAYRFGVNLVMYTLTGNYKADQVHVPALLERLGQ